MCPTVILLDDTARKRDRVPTHADGSSPQVGRYCGVYPSGDASPRVGDINVDPLISEDVLECDLPLASIASTAFLMRFSKTHAMSGSLSFTTIASSSDVGGNKLYLRRNTWLHVVDGTQDDLL